MTSVNIISGFLGAGKTTLIKKLLDGAFEGEKVVLLENEYGEVGIDGGEDPFNRGCYPWGKEDEELTKHFKTLGRIRKEHEVFKDGEFVPVSAAMGCVAYERRGRGEKIMTVANRNSHSIVYVLPEEGYKSLTGETVIGRELYLEKETAAIIFKER